MKITILFIIVVSAILLPSSVLAQSDINLTGYTQTFDEEFNTLSVTGNSPKGS